jgi:hypothetical protein
MTLLQLTMVFVFSVMSQSARRSDGLAAWQQMYSVLTSPRCINCHTANDYPQQGDDRHDHLFKRLPLRGSTHCGQAMPFIWQALNEANRHRFSANDSEREFG